MGLQAEHPLVQIERDVSASLDGLATVHEALDDYWNAIEVAGGPHVDSMRQVLFASAVAEIAGNVVRHAYPDAGADATFRIRLHYFPDRLVATLLDHGLPFDFTPPTRTADMRDALDDLDLDHGWGLPIVQAATDELDYARLPDGSNRWRLVKLLS